MNHVYQILQQWHPQRDATDWVLALVVATKGSSYRKTGAMMLIGGQGQTLGLVSGGCLEGDLKQKARKVMLSRQAEHVVYDLAAGDEPGWQPAIGCGGRVELMLFPLSVSNHYLLLDQALQRLEKKETVLWSLAPEEASSVSLQTGANNFDKNRVYMTLKPQIDLLICGGGIDAQPIAEMALLLGWKVQVNDPRIQYANPEKFIGVKISKFQPALLAAENLKNIDAAIIMHHNLNLDAETMNRLTQSQCQYIGLLGPAHRKEKVFELAGILPSDLPCDVSGPMGLDIGGDLPESIALSVLAEIHSILLNDDNCVFTSK